MTVVVPAALPSRLARAGRRFEAAGGGGPSGLNRVRVLWLLVVSVVSALAGFAADWPCRATLWETPYRYALLCYTDISALYWERGLGDGVVPYLDRVPDSQTLEYPVLTGAFVAATAQITTWIGDAGDGLARTVTFFDVNVVLLAHALAVVVLAVGALAPRWWWGAVVAASPTMLLAATINWDLLAVAAFTAALWAWARSRPVLAGVLLGAAVAAKFYPALAVPVLLLLALRTGRWRPTLLALGAGTATWLVVNVPVAVWNPEGWSWFYRFSAARPHDLGSVWLAAELLGARVEHVNILAQVTLVAAMTAIAVLALRAPRRPRLASLVFLAVAAFLAVNKVYSPQYALWLLPLVVLARPVARDVAVWLVGQGLYFVAVWHYLYWYSTSGAGGLGPDGYVVAIAAHLGATGWIAYQVCRDIGDPGRDPVRAGGVDDPGGGAFDDAPDRVVLRRR